MSFNEKHQEAIEYAQQQNYEESVKKLKELLNSTNDMINSLRNNNIQGQSISNSINGKLEEQKITWKK